MLYTIGYSNRPYEEFVSIVRGRNITQLMDVRSSPRSRNPAYSQARLEQWCAEAGITYQHEGMTLGGRSHVSPQDQAYNASTEGVIRASSRGNVALLCAEGEPEKCHRCYDIGAALILRYRVHATNVRRDGSDQAMTASLPLVSPKLFNPLIVPPGARW